VVLLIDSAGTGFVLVAAAHFLERKAQTAENLLMIVPLLVSAAVVAGIGIVESFLVPDDTPSIVTSWPVLRLQRYQRCR